MRLRIWLNLLLIFGIGSFTFSYAQSKTATFNLTLENEPLEKVLDTLSFVSNYNFTYNSSLFNSDTLSVDFEGTTIADALIYILQGKGVSYFFDGPDQIILKKALLIPSISQTFSISGKVKQEGTGVNISGVSVFLDGTTKVAFSDDNGEFQMRGIPFGSYNIVFSHVSYVNEVFEFSKSSAKDLVVDVELEIGEELLEAVEISGNLTKDKDREDYLEDFKRQFIGGSQNSQECILVNPDVIEFASWKEQGALFASSIEPVIIQNDALGYRLYCELSDFVSTSESVRTIGQVRFEELSSTDSRISKKWDQKRREAYQGSLQHFFRSLLEDSYTEEGFTISMIDNLEDMSEDMNSERLRDRILHETNQPLIWEIKFDKILKVLFHRELESSEYTHARMRAYKSDTKNTYGYLPLKIKPLKQQSLVELREESVYVDINGHVLNPTVLSIWGYWSWERMGDLVPINYDLGEKIN